MKNSYRDILGLLSTDNQPLNKIKDLKSINIELVYLKSYMFKNGFQLTMRVYHSITFLFLLIRVKLTSDFQFSYDQSDPVSLN